MKRDIIDLSFFCEMSATFIRF